MIFFFFGGFRTNTNLNSLSHTLSISLVTLSHTDSLYSYLPLARYQHSEWTDHLFLVSASCLDVLCSLLHAPNLHCHLKGGAFFFPDKTSHLKSDQLKSALTSLFFMCWQDHCPFTWGGSRCLFSRVIPLFYILTSSSRDITLLFLCTCSQTLVISACFWLSHLKAFNGS